ncbi:DUF371 domain-containing protein [Candidatus Woesearchaeota archaeon]|nr:DUF371 domain-containing protein [Candidatus Woesearchaeota archaeon]
MYTFTCRGHDRITALHVNQLSFMKGPIPAPDHTLGVKATFEPDKIQLLMKGKTTVTVTVTVNDITDSFSATINHSYRNRDEMHFRTGEFTSDRVLGTKATKGAKQLQRELITALADSETVVTVGLDFS